MLMVQRVLRVLPASTLLVCSLFSCSTAAASPAREAVERLHKEPKIKDIVQNRFFLKANRFEATPIAGYVPNNPFARRYIGGILLAYHLSESLSAEGAIMYSPDLDVNDLKGLTSTLVQIAYQGDPSGDFQQPVEKMILGATFAGRWAPVYGKINLLGEQVLNFDFYGTGGLGLLSISEYYATYNTDYGTGAEGGDSVVALAHQENKSKIAVNLGVGFDFFLTQSLALKLDARNYLYVDSEPDYDPNDNGSEPLGSRLYNVFIASAGISIYLPKMKERLFDF